MTASALDELRVAASVGGRSTADDCLGRNIELHPFDGEIYEVLDESLFSDTEESSPERDFTSDESDESDSDSDSTPPSSPPCDQTDVEFICSSVYFSDSAAADQRQWLRSIVAAGEIFLLEAETIAPLESAGEPGNISKDTQGILSMSSIPTPSPLADEQVPEICEVADSRFVCIAHLRRPPLPPPSWNRRRFTDIEDSLRRQVLEKAANRLGQPTADANWWFDEDEGATMASV